MKSHTLTFQPKYGLRQRFAFIAMPVLGAALLYAVATGEQREPLYYIGGSVLTLGSILLPFVLVRRIRFENRMVIERYLMPPREIAYADIVNVGTFSLKTRQGNVSLFGIENVGELKATLATELVQAVPGSRG